MEKDGFNLTIALYIFLRFVIIFNKNCIFSFQTIYKTSYVHQNETVQEEHRTMAKTNDSLNKKLLQAAVSATKAREIKELTEKGADINTHNEWGLTPVMLASQYNHSVAVLKEIIAEGGDIKECEPKYKSNSLHLAANCSKNPKVLEVLLEAGADLETKNYLGETALILAVNTNPETKITTQLIKLGADINARDYQGHTVLEYAKAAKKTYIVNLLKGMGAV